MGGICLRCYRVVGRDFKRLVALDDGETQIYAETASFRTDSSFLQLLHMMTFIVKFDFLDTKDLNRVVIDFNGTMNGIIESRFYLRKHDVDNNSESFGKETKNMGNGPIKDSRKSLNLQKIKFINLVLSYF